jgi:hypothetical protein
MKKINQIKENKIIFNQLKNYNKQIFRFLV